MITQYEDLKDKVVLVTGATRGIGKEIAKALAANKAHVLVNFRSRPEVAEGFCEELRSMGAQATPIQFDMTDYDQMKEAISNLPKEIGPVAGLINNAGISKDQLIMRIKPDDADAILGTNLKGPMLLTSILSRQFLKAKDVSIVNVSSIVGLMGNPGQTSYAASKAGMIGFTKSVAKELASRNIRCNAICPGFIETDMTDELDEKTQAAYRESIPLQRMGDCEEVANLALFLLSKASGYITGETIKVDGGLYI